MNNQIGYCPQYPASLSHLTMAQHLKIVYMLRGVKISRLSDAVEDCLNFYCCSHLESKNPNQLSGGGKKRLSLAMVNPTGISECSANIFMLDEAIAALDMSSQEMVKQYMQNIVNLQKKSVIFSTH